jgi:hypothetical protein
LPSRPTLPPIAGENLTADVHATMSVATVVYWTTTILSALIAALSLISTFYEVSESEPIVPVAALLLAAAIWFSGWFCRHLLTGR